jgi:hypothetical protein
VALAEKQAILDSYLENVAAVVGDITPLVVAQLYNDYPVAEDLLEQHVHNNKTELEAAMIESALYCVMNWLDRPLEVQITLSDAVRFHESIHIPPETLSRLCWSLLKVLEQVDEDNNNGIFLLQQIIKELVGVIDRIKTG